METTKINHRLIPFPFTKKQVGILCPRVFISRSPGQQDGWREEDKEGGSLKTEDPALGRSIWQRLRGEVPLLWASRSTRGTTPHTPHQLHTASHKRTALQYLQKNYLCWERTDIQRSRPTFVIQVFFVHFLQGLNFNPYRLLPACLQVHNKYG